MLVGAEQLDRAVEEAAGLRAGRTAATGLREALSRIGIVLPSLQGGHPALDGTALVDPGGCPAGTVARLTEARTTAADALPGLRAERSR